MRVRVNGEFVMPSVSPPPTNVERMVLDFLMACVATAEEPADGLGSLVRPFEGEVAV
jgi:hypothetical protein